MRATDMNALARYNYPQNPNIQGGQYGLDPASLSNQAQAQGRGQQQYNQTQHPNQHQNVNQNTNAGPLSPRATAAAASAYNLDPSILQTTIGSLLQSPAAAQMFLNSLSNSAQGQTLKTPLGGQGLNGQPGYPFPSSHTQSQQQPFSSTQNFNVNDHQDPTLALFSPLPNQDALMQHTDNLQKSYQGAADMSGDVDKLQESIDSLVRSMGLEPDANIKHPTQQTNQDVTGHNGNGTGGQGGDGFDMGIGMDEGFDPNFDVDQFLTELAKSGDQTQGAITGGEDRKPQI